MLMRRYILMLLLTLLGTLTASVEAQSSTVADTLVLTARRAYQTAGRGGKAVLLVGTLTAPAGSAVTLTSVSICLPQSTVEAVDGVEAYLTAGSDTEFFATERTPFAASPAAARLNLTGRQPLAGATCQLWVVAKVKADALLGSSLRASIDALAYEEASGNTHTEHNLNLDPSGDVKVFKSQSFVFVPTTNDCRYYRIPTMIRAKDNSLVAVSDMRYDSQADLGDSHKIDVVTRRSTDGGLTWGTPVVIARGDGKSTAACGFGDASLTRAPSGKIICTMAAGNTRYFLGMRHFFVTTSSDNGITWSEPRDITKTGVLQDKVSGTSGLGLWSGFPSSGRGLTTRAGRVMYLLNGLNDANDHSRTYLLYTDDEGDHWTLAHDQVFGEDVASNEGKLVQRSDGSLLASIRQAGCRGFNVGTPDGTRWMGETRSATLTGNDCNADIIAYNDQLLIHSLLVSNGTRAGLHLFASTDQGATWTDVFTIQEGGAGYSTLEVLENGDLAVLYEDASYGSNGYITNFVTLDRQTVLGWMAPQGNHPRVAVADNGVPTGPSTYGTFSDESNGRYATWVSNTSSGLAGLTVASRKAVLLPGTFFSTNSQFLRVIPSAPQVNDTLVLTAPEGYTIAGYELGAHVLNARESYTLTTEDGTSYDIRSASRTYATPVVKVSGLDQRSVSLVVRATGATYGLLVPWLNVTLNGAPVKKSHQGYGAYVESQLGSYFTENVGGLFALSHEGYDDLIGTYQAYVDSCSQQQFFDLQETVLDNLSYPTTGYYRIKSSGARHGDTYLAAGINVLATGDAERGYGLKTVAATGAIADASTIVRLTQVAGRRGTYRISTQDLGVVAPAGSGKPFALTAAADKGDTFTFTPVKAHAGRVTILDDSVTGRYGYLHEAVGEVGQAPVVGWTAEGTLTSPSTWQVENVPSRAYRISLQEGVAPDGSSRYFGTLFLPFGVKLQQAKAYVCTAVAGNEASLQELGYSVPAFTPVVVMGTRPSETMAVSAKATQAVGKNLLQGNCLPLPWDGVGYVLGVSGGKAGLYKADADTLPANSAFLLKGTASTGYAFTFVDLTGVRGVELSQPGDAARYNLAGQRVGNGYKGLVIVNGHKWLQR